jgi:hypothetical protein
VATDQQHFYRKIPGLGLAAAAIIVAYCQCLVYQVCVPLRVRALGLAVHQHLLVSICWSASARSTSLVAQSGTTPLTLAPAPLFACLPARVQGLWQDVFSGWLGGSRDAALLTDPVALEDSLRSSMGTLVASPRLPAFLVAPSAAALTGLLEGAYFWVAISLRDQTAV